MAVNTVLFSEIKTFLQDVDQVEASYDVAGRFFEVYEITCPLARAKILRTVCVDFSVEGWGVKKIDLEKSDIALSGVDQITFVRTDCLCQY